MNSLEDQCYKILNLIEKNQLKEEQNYSIKRIKNTVIHLLNESNNGVVQNNINFQSLVRNYVDDTGDYSNIILIELNTLAECLDDIVEK